MNVAITGASGFIGTKLVARLKARGDEVTVLSRSPDQVSESLGVEAQAWNPDIDPAPTAALSGRDAVVHLAGEPLAQRWTDDAKKRILQSRKLGTQRLVAGIQAVPEAQRPKTLVSSSAVGYYGSHHDEEVNEQTPPGDGFLADVCVSWEREADAASELGLRVVLMRTGVVLDASGGTLKSMVPIFKLGIGGPVAGGAQYLPWIHVDDIVGLYVKALDDQSWSGAYNGSAPAPVTNKAFTKALGRALHRPASVPVPAFALRLLYGEMAEVVTDGQRAVPERALAGGYTFAQPDLDAALAVALE